MAKMLGFRPPILRLPVIFFRFFSFVWTTNQKLGNTADTYWKKGGWLVGHTEFHNNNIYSNSIIVYHPLNRPFPSSPRPLYQNEVRCSTFDKEWFFILLQIKLISTRKVVHLALFWKWGFLELGSGLSKGLARDRNMNFGINRFWNFEKTKVKFQSKTLKSCCCCCCCCRCRWWWWWWWWWWWQWKK